MLHTRWALTRGLKLPRYIIVKSSAQALACAIALAAPVVVQAFAPSLRYGEARRSAERGGGRPAQTIPVTIETGGRLFRERCADCHGGDAKGSRGPDLTGLWTNAAADDRAFQTIRTGIPGSIMPPSSAPDDEVRAIISYLRSIGTAGAGERSAGNAMNGERIFSASCSSCHRVKGRGGRLGPDLSQIGNQSRQAIARSIREASASFTSGYEPVMLVTRDGRQIRGTRKSEDPFSIQIMDTSERLQGYLKTGLRDVTRDTRSLMPDYGPDRLSEEDLNDLLGFLATLRASGSTP